MSTITSFTLAGALGVDAVSISIGCIVDSNKPNSFHVSGVSTTHAKEICARVRSAVYTTGLCSWPEGRVTIEIRSGGAKLQAAALDLPIACAIANLNLEGLLVAGELGLDGRVRPVRGVVQATLMAKSLGMIGVLVPRDNERDAKEAIGNALGVYTIAHLVDLNGSIETLRVDRTATVKPSRATLDFSEVRGQPQAISFIERAVRTRSNVLMSGPPGVGKTMIARRIPTVLPPMSKDEQIEVTQAFSAIGMSDGLVTERPFRAPHYTISATALAGGGVSPRPGEVQLASCGVLFLDEISEFPRASIEALTFALRMMPAATRPLVVASATPCPCGWRGSDIRTCTCRPDSIARHEARIKQVTEQLQLTMHMELHPVSLNELRAAAPGESSATIAARIVDGATV